jgi:hypothetical protein
MPLWLSLSSNTFNTDFLTSLCDFRRRSTHDLSILALSILALSIFALSTLLCQHCFVNIALSTLLCQYLLCQYLICQYLICQYFPCQLDAICEYVFVIVVVVLQFVNAGFANNTRFVAPSSDLN